MKRTEDILEKLKKVEKPQIDLTEEIISSLTPVPSPVREGRSINFLPIVRTVLSLAAMWIVGFFLYLQYEAYPRGGMEGAPVVASEGASTLREVYKYRLCQDCKKTISYTQIKNILYENK